MESTVKFDLRVLTLVMSLTFFSEFLAFLMQYKINRVYRGIGWWLAAIGTMSVGVILMAVLYLPVVDFFARFGIRTAVLPESMYGALG